MTTPSPGSEVRACVFDAYGTLFDVNAAAASCRDVLGDRADVLAALWRTKQLEYSWLRSLRGDYVDFWHITGQSLDFAMASLGLDDIALRSRLMAIYFSLPAYPDAPPTLHALKAAGVKVAILSNGSPSMLVAAVQSADLHDLLDAVISANAAGVYKPHPTVYQLACDRLKMVPSRITFVSANYWDASGAARFGFRVIWVNRSGGRRDALPCEPAHEVTSLSELPALLDLAEGAAA